MISARETCFWLFLVALYVVFFFCSLSGPLDLNFFTCVYYWPIVSGFLWDQPPTRLLRFWMFFLTLDESHKLLWLFMCNESSGLRNFKTGVCLFPVWCSATGPGQITAPLSLCAFTSIALPCRLGFTPPLPNHRWFLHPRHCLCCDVSHPLMICAGMAWPVKSVTVTKYKPVSVRCLAVALQ